MKDSVDLMEVGGKATVELAPELQKVKAAATELAEWVRSSQETKDGSWISYVSNRLIEVYSHFYFFQKSSTDYSEQDYAPTESKLADLRVWIEDVRSQYKDQTPPEEIQQELVKRLEELF